MSHPPPTPPQDLPDDVVEAFEGFSPDLLRRTATYADRLADHCEREHRPAEAEQDDADRDVTDDRPDGVPTKATLTVKEINDNRYYYWQWRDGDKVRSKYEGPAGDGS